MQTNVSDAQLCLVAYILYVQMGLKAETACVEKQPFHKAIKSTHTGIRWYL